MILYQKSILSQFLLIQSFDFNLFYDIVINLKLTNKKKKKHFDK